MTTDGSDNPVLSRMVKAVAKTRERLVRAVNTLAAAEIPYAVAGDCAVAAWVATVDVAAVRNTQDVDILLRRSDLAAARSALEAAGFHYRHAAGLDIFLDTPDASPRGGVHIVFANEKVRAHEPVANPDVDVSGEIGAFRVLSLEALVRIKLTAFRDKDRTHLRDLIGVGLVDATWVARMQDELGARLQSLIDTPEG